MEFLYRDRGKQKGTELTRLALSHDFLVTMGKSLPSLSLPFPTDTVRDWCQWSSQIMESKLDK